jgi:hypothetical protein
MIEAVLLILQVLAEACISFVILTAIYRTRQFLSPMRLCTRICLSVLLSVIPRVLDGAMFFVALLTLVPFTIILFESNRGRHNDCPTRQGR